MTVIMTMIVTMSMTVIMSMSTFDSSAQAIFPNPRSDVCKVTAVN